MNNKAEIKYPCMWGFRIIGEDKEKMRKAVKECIDNQDVNIEDNNQKGKYYTQKFEAYCTNEEERNEFFKRLNKHKDIKFVL